MNSDLATQLFAELLVNASLVAAPVLLSTLMIGLLVSVFQVVTQIQETSLTFIPKMIGAALVLVFAGPWMLKRLTEYASRLLTNIPHCL